MKRKFISNLILLLTLNLLIKPFWIFGIDRTVQNMFGDHDYGLYFSLFNFSMLLNILLDAGITSYNNRNIAQHRFLLNKHLSNIVGIKFLLALAYAVITFAAALVIGYDRLQLHLLLFLVFNQFLISFTQYLRSNISALHLFSTDSLLSVLDRSIMIILCSILLFTGWLPIRFTIHWFVYIQTIAYTLSCVITFSILLRHAGTIHIRFRPHFAAALLRKSIPYALLILLMSFYNRIDSVMLERLLPGTVGKEQAGIYAQAFRLLDAVSMFGVLFAGLLLPIFAKMIKDREDLAPMIKLSYTLLIIPAVIIAASCYFYHQPIMNLLYHSNTNKSAELLQILMFGFIGIATTYIFGTLLTANGSIKQLNLMAAGGMILNILLNALLIPRMQAQGAAIASLVTQLCTGFTQMLLAMYIFKLQASKKFVIRILLFVIGVVGIGLLSQQIGNWGYGYFLMIAGSLCLAVLFRLFNLKDLFFIIKNG